MRCISRPAVTGIWLGVMVASGCAVAVPDGLACDDSHGCAAGQQCISGICSTLGADSASPVNSMDGSSPGDARTSILDGAGSLTADAGSSEMVDAFQPMSDAGPPDDSGGSPDSGSIDSGSRPDGCVVGRPRPPATEWARWPMPGTPGPSADGTSQPVAVAVDYDVRSDSVVDRVTGLQWQRILSTDVYNAAQAEAYCDALVLDCADDWRLPTRIELITIVSYDRARPAITDVIAFPNTPSQPFWTSSRASAPGDNTWYVSFTNGFTDFQTSDMPYPARCVR